MKNISKQDKMAAFGYQVLPTTGGHRRKLYFSSQVPFVTSKCHNFADETSGVLAENIVAFTCNEANGGVIAMIDANDRYYFINRNNQRIVEPKKLSSQDAAAFVLNENLCEAFLKLPKATFQNVEFITDCYKVLKEVLEGSEVLKLGYSTENEREYTCVTNKKENQEMLKQIEQKIIDSMDDYSEVLDCHTL